MKKNLIIDDDSAINRAIAAASQNNGRKVVQAPDRQGDLKSEYGECYRDIIRSLGEGVIFSNTDHVFTFANPAAEAIFGVWPGQLIGKKIEDFLSEKDREIFRKQAILRRALQKSEYELEIQAADGQCRRVLVTGAPQIGPDGQWAGSASVLHDITQRKRIESALRESQRLQKAMLDNIPDPAWLKDKDGRYVIGNKSLATLYHRQLGEILGKTILEVFPERASELTDGDKTAAVLGKVLRTENCLPDEYGKDRWFDTIETPIFDESGKVAGSVGIARDITERRKSEQDLAHERDLLQSLMDNLPDLIYFKDTHSQFTRINAALAKHLGLKSPEDAIGKSDADFFPFELARQKFKDEQSIISTGEPILGLIEESGTHDEKVWVSSTKVPFRDKDGNITGLVGISRNITDFMRAEESLRDQKESFSALANNVPDAVARLDREFRFVYGNRALAKDLGFEPVDFLGKTGAEMGLPADELWQKELNKVFLSGKTRSFEFQFSRSNGTNYRETRLVPELSPKGEVEFVLAITRDVTEQKQTENERRAMELQLRHAQKLEAIGQLAAGIAHEINTPTQYVGDNTRFLQEAFTSIETVLRSHVALLAATKENAVTPELLASADEVIAASDLEYLFDQIPPAISQTLEGVDRVTKIVRAMKEFSHPGGREKSAADLNKAIETTVTVTRNEWKYVADLKLDLAPDLPLVPCFIGEFNQCILNLIVNAAHAIGDVVKKNPGTKGLIAISTRLDNQSVEIRVSDTGTGIAEDHRPHIFEMFFTTKDIGRGTGQGLALVYNSIVKHHGGTVAFETEVGRGSTFILRLPINPGINAPPTERPPVGDTANSSKGT
ncbi:MAG: PAS domain-containing protein [Limisphaerales bacterium]